MLTYEDRRKGAAARGRQLAQDKEFQKRARSMQSRESCADKGRKGFRALCAKIGYDEAISRIQKGSAERRRERPSSLELVVHGWLTEAGISFEVEGEIAGWWWDVVVGDKAIEIDGAVFHDEGFRARPDVQARKEKALASTEVQLLRVSEADVHSGAAKDVIFKFLEVI